ncbi:hypothetical protein LTR28_004897 [Elasticomyces elasticus]|nr:hypothetical protein LTR28_004897 [Elasticomyces elasticus]
MAWMDHGSMADWRIGGLGWGHGGKGAHAPSHPGFLPAARQPASRHVRRSPTPEYERRRAGQGVRQNKSEQQQQHARAQPANLPLRKSPGITRAGASATPSSQDKG